MISTTPRIEGNAVRDAIKELKALDKNLVKEMRKDLRTKISPFAKQIADSVPVEARCQDLVTVTLDTQAIQVGLGFVLPFPLHLASHAGQATT